MKTLKELADIGAAAASGNKCYHYISVSEKAHSWNPDEPARQAFAQAVRDAVLADMLPKFDSGTSVKTVPLDIDDIRATDEFKRHNCNDIRTAQSWSQDHIWLANNAAISYATLSKVYLRRQHGSDEWKPCNKEEVK